MYKNIILYFMITISFNGLEQKKEYKKLALIVWSENINLKLIKILEFFYIL